MIKLIIGVKGSGKTKTLIDMANAALEKTDGSVVCLEKGTKLIHEIKYQARLIDTDEYLICGAEELYGFISGVYASNNDVTDIFIDSAFKICAYDLDKFEKFMDRLAAFAGAHSVNFVITSSIPVETASESLKKYL